MDSCDCSVICLVVSLTNSHYLHGTAQAEDAVVGLLWREALEGGLDDVVLFGENVIGPVRQSALAHAPKTPIYALLASPSRPILLPPRVRTSVQAACIRQRCSTSRRAAPSSASATGAC